MRTIEVKASTSYSVLVGKGIVSSCGKEVAKACPKAQKLAVVTDDQVDALYSGSVLKFLSEAGFSVCKFVFIHGEAQKSSSTLYQLYNFLAENQFTRTDALIALGGGVVGDLTGFAAATFLRGMDFIQIPTTLLAQVDSSVGGKTAIDLPGGKNLVGAFKQPKLVLCDIDTLSTLPEEFFTDGMGECIKYGMIRSEALFRKLEKEDLRNPDSLEEMIAECISIKRDVVEADEFDQGQRMLLNFGHTLGHAIEKHGNFTQFTHGNAVAAGMYLLTRQTEKAGFTEAGTSERLAACLRRYGLPLTADIPFEELAPLCLNDKKMAGSLLRLVLCRRVGDSFLREFEIPAFRRLLGIKEAGDGH